MNIIEHFIDGKKVSGSSKRTAKVFNPATGEQSAEVRLASTKDLDTAVQAAKKAFVTWSAKPPLQRARILFKFKELIIFFKTVLVTPFKISLFAGCVIIFLPLTIHTFE